MMVISLPVVGKQAEIIRFLIVIFAEKYFIFDVSFSISKRLLELKRDIPLSNYAVN